MGERSDLVFLIGFMGAGKTTVGRVLARIMGWDFVDLDEEIVGAEHRSIPQIFAREGEAYFRRREAELLAALRGRTRMVVACGGGTYAHEENRRLIDGMGRSVWIRLPLEVALRRCAGGASRPLLKDESQAEALYRLRLPCYQEAALQVDAAGLSAEETAERIAGLL